MNNFPLYGRMHQRRKNTRNARLLAEIWERETGRSFPGGVKNAWLRQLNPTSDQASVGAWQWELGALNLLPTYAFCASEGYVRGCIKDPDLIDFDTSGTGESDERLATMIEKGLPTWSDWRAGRF